MAATSLQSSQNKQPSLDGISILPDLLNNSLSLNSPGCDNTFTRNSQGSNVLDSATGHAKNEGAARNKDTRRTKKNSAGVEADKRAVTGRYLTRSRAGANAGKEPKSRGNSDETSDGLNDDPGPSLASSNIDPRSKQLKLKGKGKKATSKETTTSSRDTGNGNHPPNISSNANARSSVNSSQNEIANLSVNDEAKLNECSSRMAKSQRNKKQIRKLSQNSNVSPEESETLPKNSKSNTMHPSSDNVFKEPGGASMNSSTSFTRARNTFDGDHTSTSVIMKNKSVSVRNRPSRDSVSEDLATKLPIARKTQEISEKSSKLKSSLPLSIASPISSKVKQASTVTKRPALAGGAKSSVIDRRSSVSSSINQSPNRVSQRDRSSPSINQSSSTITQGDLSLSTIDGRSVGGMNSSRIASGIGRGATNNRGSGTVSETSRDNSQTSTAANKRTNLRKNEKESVKTLEKKLKTAELKTGQSVKASAMQDKESAMQENESLRANYEMKLDELRQLHDDEMRNLELSIKNESAEHINNERIKFEKEVEDQKRMYEDKMQNEKKANAVILMQLQKEHSEKLIELENQHTEKISNLEKVHSEAELKLKLDVESLNKELRMREEELSNNLKKREMDVSRDLCLEAESLRHVLEQKNEELHRYRQQLNDAKHKLEELPKHKDQIQRLQQKIDNLEAIIDIKTDNERSLAKRQAELLKLFNKEAREKMQISQNNEQLQWLLSQSEEATVSDGVIDCPTSESVSRRRGSAGRGVPGSAASRMSRSCDTPIESRMRSSALTSVKVKSITSALMNESAGQASCA